MNNNDERWEANVSAMIDIIEQDLAGMPHEERVRRVKKMCDVLEAYLCAHPKEPS